MRPLLLSSSQYPTTTLTLAIALLLRLPFYFPRSLLRSSSEAVNAEASIHSNNLTWKEEKRRKEKKREEERRRQKEERNRTIVRDRGEKAKSQEREGERVCVSERERRGGYR